MADWNAVRIQVPDCESLCRMVELAIKQIEHRYLAVMIYSSIIAVIAATVVRKEYFDKLFYKLRAHGINTNGAKNVWHFTLAIFLFNATLHAVEILLTDTDHNFLAYAPLEKLSWLTVFRAVYSLGNIGLWLWAAILYKRDAAAVFSLMSLEAKYNPEADTDALFQKRKALLVTYFTPVALLFAFDDTLSKNWEVFKTTDALRSLLAFFQTLHGWPVPIALIVLALMAIATIVVAMFYQEKVRDIGWKLLVYSVPFAMPIASALIIGTIAVAFIFSGGREHSSTAELTPIESATPALTVTSASSAPVKRAASQ